MKPHERCGVYVGWQMQKRNENHKGVSFRRVFLEAKEKKKKKITNQIIKRIRKKTVQCNIDRERSKLWKEKLQTKFVQTN